MTGTMISAFRMQIQNYIKLFTVPIVGKYIPLYFNSPNLKMFYNSTSGHRKEDERG
jgi:ascorbate-specific PTS system EIIC-type component UlaA